jgi:hypothetical protein
MNFSATILKFGQQGEKTGWSYILITDAIAEKLNPGNKKSFRVKGKLDNYSIEKLALLPMGNGEYILPLNATIRKAIRKEKGAKVNVQIQVDKEEIKPPKDLLECLADEPESLAFFNSLSRSHRNYFIKWIDAAKTDATKAKRISRTLEAMSKRFNFSQMLHSLKNIDDLPFK